MQPVWKDSLEYQDDSTLIFQTVFEHEWLETILKMSIAHCSPEGVYRTTSLYVHETQDYICMLLSREPILQLLNWTCVASDHTEMCIAHCSTWWVQEHRFIFACCFSGHSFASCSVGHVFHK